MNSKKQYTRYSIFKRNFLNFVKDIPECTEVDIFHQLSDNKEPYAYIHIKDYSDDPQSFRKILKSLHLYLNNYKYVEMNCGERKCLFWIPKHKDVKRLQVDGCTYWINRFANENSNS